METLDLLLLNWEHPHKKIVGGLGIATNNIERAIRNDISLNITSVFPGTENKEYERNGINYREIKVPSKLIYSKRMSSINLMHELFSEKKFDVAHGHGWLTGEATIKSARNSIVTHHLPEKHRVSLLSNSNNNPGLTENIINREKYIFKNVSINHFTTQYITSRVLEQYDVCQNINIFPIGIDTDVFSPGTADPDLELENQINPEDIVILTTSRIHAHRQINLALDSISYLFNCVLPNESCKYCFVGQGSPENVANFKKQIYENNLEDKVIFKNVYYPNLELPKIYEALRKASILIYFNHTPHETQGLGVTESMSMKVPSVVLGKGGPKEVIGAYNSKNGFGDAGIVIDMPELNLEQVSDAFKLLIEDRQLYNTMANKGRDRAVIHFSLPVFRNHLKKAYSSSE